LGALGRRAEYEQPKMVIAEAQLLAGIGTLIGRTAGTRVWPDERRWAEEKAGRQMVGQEGLKRDQVRTRKKQRMRTNQLPTMKQRRRKANLTKEGGPPLMY